MRRARHASAIAQPMPAPLVVLVRRNVRRIFLPETTKSLTWGHPKFFRVTPNDRVLLCAQFSPAPYRTAYDCRWTPSAF